MLVAFLRVCACLRAQHDDERKTDRTPDPLTLMCLRVVAKHFHGTHRLGGVLRHGQARG